MVDDFIAIENQNNLYIVRFNRPQERNPLSVGILSKLEELLSTLVSNSNTKALIFTGSTNVFASGANLREIAALKTHSEIRAFGLRGQQLMEKIADAPFPTIAAINGYCFGGAFDLALACQIRIASPNAIFSHPGANLGIMTGWGGTQRLPRIIGEAAALEMFLTAKRIDAPEALKINLISKISDCLLDDALKTALNQVSAKLF